MLTKKRFTRTGADYTFKYAVHVLDARTEFMSWLAQTNTAAPAVDSTWVATAADDNGAHGWMIWNARALFTTGERFGADRSIVGGTVLLQPDPSSTEVELVLNLGGGG